MKRSIEEEVYRFCLLNGKPYFGNHLHATQGQIERHRHMRSLALNEIARRPNQPLNILEIGSWAGGSAITWAGALKDAKAVGHVFCVDAWKPYGHAESLQAGNMKEMNEELRAGEIFPLFLHNIRCLGYEDVVVPIRGESNVVLPFLAQERFQIVFVDGDHRIEAVRWDIIQSQKLVASDGILCGDDLELQVSDIDIAEAKLKKDQDFIKDPKTGEMYHPGVSLAVHETFEKVSVREGFWAVRKTSSGWQPLELLPQQDLKIPAHMLEPSSVRLTFELLEHLKSMGLL